MDDPWADVERAGEWLLGLAAATRPEVIHLSEPVFASLPWRSPVLAVGHSCVLSWYEAVRGTPAPASWSRYREAMTDGFDAADAVAAPSHAMLRALERHYGVRHGTVVANGRDPARYRPGPKVERVLTAGRLWDPAKNVALLAAVAAALPWPVEAAGETRSPDGISAPDPGALRLLGPLDETAMARRLSRASIYALPARYEPFGLSVLEAALAGCALVLGDIPSLRELWEGAAVFVPPEDPEALRAGLEKLMFDPGSRQALALRARRRALQFSPAQMALGYLDLYRQLREAPRRSRRREVTACAS
jgi:glycosyltransferase involved in cell wall biosynthesis